MKARQAAPRSARARRGFSLVEISLSLTVFTIIGFALSDTVRIGSNAQRAVLTTTADNRELRSASASVGAELKGTSSARLTVMDLESGNDAVTFQLPIEVAGNATWGVEEPALGATEDEQLRENWSLRYTVEDSGQGYGDVVRNLMRQVIDEQGLVQHESVLISGLSREYSTPGFEVISAGDMWEVRIRLAAEGSEGDRTTVFHFRARN